MSWAVSEVKGYRCQRCDNISEAKSQKTDDRPPGFYFYLHKVTDSNGHYISDGEIFVCSKQCFREYVEYGITHSLNHITPIGRTGRRR